MKEGVLKLHEKSTIGRTKPQRVIVFLFNDVLLVARPKNQKYFEKDKRQKNCFTQKAHIRLGTAKLIGISVEKESVENCFEIQFIEGTEDDDTSGKTDSVILSASSSEEEMTWTKDIKGVIREYQRKKFFEVQKAKAEAMVLLSILSPPQENTSPMGIKQMSNLIYNLCSCWPNNLNHVASVSSDRTPL